MPRRPALSVIGTPTKRTPLLEAAAEADRLGFAGLASPGVHGNLAMCGSLAHVTSTIPFWTSIQPIYHSHPTEVAITAGHLAEVSGGRFRLGLGVSHAPAMDRLGITTGKPLSDVRQYVAGIRAAERSAGALPPIILATLRDRMLDLALEIADGAVWANASQSYMPTQVARIPDRSAWLVLDGQHGADDHRRRPPGGPGDPPPHAGRLRHVAELPQLLEARRATRTR